MPPEQHGSILSAFPLPAMVIGTGERIINANSEARRLLRQDIVDRHYITVIRQPVVLDAIEACFRDGKPRQARYLGSDRSRDTMHLVRVAAYEDGGRSAFLVTFEDVTQIETAAQMRRDFVANVSHELRTPLTAMMGFIETLRGPARDDSAARERFLAIMEDEARRMDRLVGDLLSLSRVEDQERVRPSERVDIAGLLQSVADSLGEMAAQAGVELTLQGAEQPLELPGDAEQLRQVVSNLVVNAVKYSGTGSHVRLGLGRPAREQMLQAEGVRVTVEDDGPGIEPHHIPRLTERFYRVDSHRSREMGGTGLGLAIVKHVINRHRGRLRIESTPGRGTRITVVLPTG